MTEQPSLFVDERKPCAACKGTGKRMNHELGWRDEQPCPSCGGTGKEADRPDPAQGKVPY